MTYLKSGIEYLTPEEMSVYQAVKLLNKDGRTTNNSQVAGVTGMSRTRCALLADGLKRRGYLIDAYPNGSAYHWRTTGKEVHTQ